MQISGDLEVFPPQKCLVCGGNSSWPLLVGVFTSKNIRKNSGLGIISPEAPWRCVENGILEKKQKNIPSRELTNISKKKGKFGKSSTQFCAFLGGICVRSQEGVFDGLENSFWIKLIEIVFFKCKVPEKYSASNILSTCWSKRESSQNGYQLIQGDHLDTKPCPPAYPWNFTYPKLFLTSSIPLYTGS